MKGGPLSYLTIKSPHYLNGRLVFLCVTGPVKVRVARYLRDSGVFTSLPKWDKSRSLLSCA